MALALCSDMTTAALVRSSSSCWVGAMLGKLGLCLYEPECLLESTQVWPEGVEREKPPDLPNCTMSGKEGA